MRFPPLSVSCDTECDDRITIPAQLRQLYAFVPSQVKEAYLYFLLLNLCSLTGASPSALRRDLASSKKSSQRGNNKRRRDDGPDDEEESPIDRLPQTIIFVNRPYTSQLLHTLLSLPSLPFPISSAPLHSSLPQTSRLASLNLFRSRKVPVLIATDVASRGLDIPEVEVVINWEVPRQGDEYVHRVGRTARAGKGGVSVSFVGEGDVDCVLGVEERVGRKMEEVEMKEDKVLEYLNVVSQAKREAQLVRPFSFWFRDTATDGSGWDSNSKRKSLARSKRSTSSRTDSSKKPSTEPSAELPNAQRVLKPQLLPPQRSGSP